MARASRGDDAAVLQELAQGDAVHELHEEEVEPVGPAEIVNGHDARVVQFGQRFGFAGKALGKGGVLADVGREDFKGDNAVEFFLAGFVDGTHAAAADKLDNFQARERGQRVPGLRAG